MDTTDLDLAYLQLLATADGVVTGASCSPRIRFIVDRTLGRVACEARVLAGAGRDVLTGHPAEICLGPAGSRRPDGWPALSSARRRELVARTAVDLIAVAATVPAAAARMPVRLCVLGEGGQVTAVSVSSWGELVSLHATRDLSGHISRLAMCAYVR